MITLLTLLSSLLWWVLYSSIFALFFALIAYAVLRWTERSRVLFNRVLQMIDHLRRQRAALC